MKVLLLNPPLLKFYMRFPETPLGLIGIAASIRDRHQVKIMDLNMEPMPTERLLKAISEFGPDMIGVTSTTPAFSHMEKLCRTIKEHYPVPVVFGGNHVTALPENSLTYPGIDYVIVREGELSFKQFLDEYEPGRQEYEVPGLGYKTREGEIRVNPPGPPIEPLDQLPWSAWDLLPMKRYRTRFRYFVNMMFSRGCPHACIYCASHLTHGRRIRRRSLDHLIGELRMLSEKYGTQFVAFWDDVLTADRDYMMEFCERMLSEGPKIEFWGNTRVDKVDPELLQMMARAGCQFLSYGVETGTDTTLSLIRKGTTLDQTVQAVEWTKKAGITVHGYLMVNFPGETEQDMKETIDFAFKLKLPFFDLWSALPYPGTRYEQICREKGLIPDEIPKDFSNFWFVEDIVENGIVPAERVRRLIAQARKRMITRPIFVTQMTRRFIMGAKPLPRDLLYYTTLVPVVLKEMMMGSSG